MLEFLNHFSYRVKHMESSLPPTSNDEAKELSLTELTRLHPSFTKAALILSASIAFMIPGFIYYNLAEEGINLVFPDITRVEKELFKIAVFATNFFLYWYGMLQASIKAHHYRPQLCTVPSSCPKKTDLSRYTTNTIVAGVSAMSIFSCACPRPTNNNTLRCYRLCHA